MENRVELYSQGHAVILEILQDLELDGESPLLNRWWWQAYRKHFQDFPTRESAYNRLMYF